MRADGVLVGGDGLSVNGSATVALAADDGRELWRAEGTFPLALAPDGAAYVGAANEVRALEPSTGAVRWRVALAGKPDVNSAAVDEEGTLYVAEGLSTVVAIGAEGVAKWRARPRLTVYRLIVGAGDALFAGNGTTDLVCLGRDDGAQRWSHDSLIGDPTVRDDGVLIGYDASSSAVFELDPTDGHTIASHSLPRDTIGSLTPAIAPDGSLRLHGNGTIVSLAPDGDVAWTAAADAGVGTRLTVDSAGNTWFGGGAGGIYAIDASGHAGTFVDVPGEFHGELVIDGATIYRGGPFGASAFGD